MVWCGQSDGMSKPCKTQPTHNTTHKPHMPPTPSITHPQHPQVHPHSPFLLCVSIVRHVTCTVWGGWHSPTHCSAVLHPLCSSLSVPLFHHHHLKKHPGGVERKEGERSGWGNREEEEEERCDAKNEWKRGAKREKEITTPGVPRLSPTLVLTRPEQA